VVAVVASSSGSAFGERVGAGLGSRRRREGDETG
jgi:hypothetical protein